MVERTAILKTFFDYKETEWGQELEFPNSRSLVQYTHRIFNRYPARSIFIVPRAILAAYIQDASCTLSEINVLDPFLGSGTTAIEASLHSIRPFGVEADPFARLVSEVSTRAYAPHQLQRLKNTYQEVADFWKDFSADECYYPKLQKIEYWFDEQNFEELLKLKTAIFHFAGNEKDDLDFLRVVLADMIRPCSKAERQSLKPYISKKYVKTPANVQETFKKSFLAHFHALAEFSDVVGHAAAPVTWIGDDATQFRTTDRMDIAITSPPYINALDYVRCIKLESTWAGCADDDILSSLRGKQVGERPNSDFVSNPAIQQHIEDYVSKIEKRDRSRALIISNYFHDMHHNLSRTYEALKGGGEYHLIVGNSTVRGVEIPTYQVIAELAQMIGYDWTRYYRYIIKDHRTSIPRNGNGGKIRYEHVVTLRKPT